MCGAPGSRAWSKVVPAAGGVRELALTCEMLSTGALRGCRAARRQPRLPAPCALPAAGTKPWLSGLGRPEYQGSRDRVVAGCGVDRDVAGSAGAGEDTGASLPFDPVGARDSGT